MSPKGEFHEIAQSASGVLLTGVAQSREIHLERQCASEVPVTGVVSEGEFHGNAQSAPEALLAVVPRSGEIHLENQCASECPVDGVRLRGGQKFVPPQKTLLLESR